MDTDSWNNRVALAAAATLAGILGFAYGATFSNGCGEAAAAGAVFGCAEFFIYRYQTLIGVGGALIAALIAARPAWAQLQEIRTQSAVQAYEFVHRLQQTVASDHRIVRRIRLESPYARVAEEFARTIDQPKLLKAITMQFELYRDDLQGRIDELALAGTTPWGDAQVRSTRKDVEAHMLNLIAAISSRNAEFSNIYAFHQKAADPERWIVDSKVLATLSPIPAACAALAKICDAYLATADAELARLGPMVDRAQRRANQFA